jgi:hypothetical protein
LFIKDRFKGECDLSIADDCFALLQLYCDDEIIPASHNVIEIFMSSF